MLLQNGQEDRRAGQLETPVPDLHRLPLVPHLTQDRPEADICGDEQRVLFDDAPVEAHGDFGFAVVLVLEG